jgi:hypothetical protein
MPITEHAMIHGTRKLPVRHISIQVPWHDDSWRAAGIVSHDEIGDTDDVQGILICTRDDSKGGIDAQAIASLIEEVLQN